MNAHAFLTSSATLTLETKFIAFDAPPDVSADGAIEGYASIFGVADKGGDVVESGAFAKSLAMRAQAGSSIKMLWQHDPTSPIGVWSETAEDARGLRVRGNLVIDTRQGAEAAALLRAGAIDGLSIGYRAVRAEKDPHTGHRHLIEIDLWEVSLVTFPMMPAARATPRIPPRDDALARVLVEAFSEAPSALF